MLRYGLAGGDLTAMTVCVLVTGYEYDYGLDSVRVFSSEAEMKQWIADNPKRTREYYEFYVAEVDGPMAALIGEVG